jgi:tryptophan synthase alpha chain
MTSTKVRGIDRLSRLPIGKKKILSIFTTEGFPGVSDTIDVLVGLEKYGADLIEIGFPFSDPVADGPVIQNSNEVAIKNGMTLARLFEQLRDIRDKISIPLVLMGSFNPVLSFGVVRFLDACVECGIDGTILPDLPAREFERDLQASFVERGISNILLMTTRTTVERAKYIDSLSSSLIYLVSSEGVTGGSLDVDHSRSESLAAISRLGLRHPLLVGFGIRDRAGFKSAAEHHAGAVIGSAFINALKANGAIEENIKKFMSAIVEG